MRARQITNGSVSDLLARRLEVRLELQDGRRHLLSVLREPEAALETVPIGDALCWTQGLDESATARILILAKVTWGRRIGLLSAKEVATICFQIKTRHPETWAKWKLTIGKGGGGGVKLGTGGSGPWENRTHRLGEIPGQNPFIVAGHLNAEHSVQRFQYPEHPGVDLLTVRRHDGGDQHPGWKALQSIKNVLAPDGTERFGFEHFPPARWVIDNYNLWHIWVMPIGWQPGVGIHPEQEGGGLRV